MPDVIETTRLVKSYDGAEALRGLDLRVAAGSICGFLGRNGAGKTTTIKILLGMARPTRGSAMVFGERADSPQAGVEIRRRVGFVSEEKDLYGSMSVDEMIRFTRSFFPKWRSDLQERYLRRFDLPLDRKVKALSRGTRTKLALLLALCRGAELLLLDEPTSGLDPAMAEEVLRAIITQVAEDGTTVLFSSHQLSEVDEVADHVVIIERGRAAIAGSLDDLRAGFRRVHLVFEGPAPEREFASPGVERVRRKGREMTILVRKGADALLTEARVLNPISVDVVPVTLKEIFLETTTED